VEKKLGKIGDERVPPKFGTPVTFTKEKTYSISPKSAPSVSYRYNFRNANQETLETTIKAGRLVRYAYLKNDGVPYVTNESLKEKVDYDFENFDRSINTLEKTEVEVDPVKIFRKIQRFKSLNKV